MFLSKSELKNIMTAYNCENFIEVGHYQVEPDTWVYLFRGKNDKKYILIDADNLDFDFETYPHLLKFNNGEFKELEFVLQREMPLRDSYLREEVFGTLLFEYTD